jgi:hypothetical protein
LVVLPSKWDYSFNMSCMDKLGGCGVPKILT